MGSFLRLARYIEKLVIDARYIKMSLRVKVWDLKRAVKYYSLYRGARYIDARYSESSLY